AIKAPPKPPLSAPAMPRVTTPAPPAAPQASGAAAPAGRAPAIPGPSPASVPAARGGTERTPAPAAVARPRVPHAEPRKAGRLITWNKVGFFALLLVLYLGWSMPTERYITPTRGFGYALGIIGGSLMLLLLVYSARKHFTWLSWLGPTPSWFRFHMVLGILWPVCILYHANFATGPASSNVGPRAM